MEVAESLEVVIDKHPIYREKKILERIAEPERVIMFRVPWIDDKGEVQINRGFRIEMNSAIGPYKGGLRFHPTVNLGLLKFLAFEQIFKNSLTTLPMGGGKGGSDFDPKGKSDNEVMRFCQSLMTELCRHIGQFTDVPAGDIGVGGREIGFMFGQYKRVRNEFVGVLTGKGLNWGGSLIRPEATGYGAVYFAAEMLATRDETLEGKTCLVSGSGNVAQYAIEKILDLGGKPVTAQRLGGLHLRRGRHRPREARLRARAQERQARPHQRVRRQVPGRGVHGASTTARASTRCGITRPTAPSPAPRRTRSTPRTPQNLVDNGVYVISEGANMPTVPEGVNLFVEKKLLYGPGKAANAGGVATSGLEMSQNSLRLSWTREEVDARLHGIMKAIHKQCVDASAAYGFEGNYVAGANIAGFLKVADSMLDQGVV